MSLIPTTRSQFSHTVTTLPGGLLSEGYAVYTIGNVFDTWGATASSNVSVVVFVDATADIAAVAKTYLANTLSDAFASGNVHKAMQSINAVASSLGMHILYI